MPSFFTYFTLTTGLREPLVAPAGTLARWTCHVESVETTLKIPVERDGFDESLVRDVRPRWRLPREFDVDDETLCRVARDHNRWVRRAYEDLGRWMHETPTGDVETITLDQAAEVWRGFETFFDVPVQRWTRDYYQERAEHLYQVMRGQEDEGVQFGAPPLTIEQARAVTILMSQFLDTHDIRLDVPRGWDSLANRYDGEYDWCEHCGAVAEDDPCEHVLAEYDDEVDAVDHD